MQLDKLLIEKVDEYFEVAKNLSDFITDNPELGMEEGTAVSAYKKTLEEHGFIVETPYKGVKNSFLAIKKDRINEQGPKAVLMCEYDALPEMGHACGHSMSGSASLLAALALYDAYPDLPLRIDLIGTPGEEFPGGKVMLSQEGAFDGYEFAAMVHMGPSNSPAFSILASNDRYISFKGRSSHASADPESGINSLNAARLYMDAMDMWRQHLPSGSQFHGIVVKGGDLPSIVPDQIDLNFYLRAENLNDLDALSEISEKCCKGAAIATGCSYEAKQQYLTYADLSNVPSSVSAVEKIFDAMGEEYHYDEKPQGSSDAGNVDYLIPVFHPFVNVSHDPNIPIHTPEFEKLMKSETGYAGLRKAGVLLSQLSYFLGTNEDELEKIKKEHAIHRGLKL